MPATTPDAALHLALVERIARAAGYTDDPGFDGITLWGGGDVVAIVGEGHLDPTDGASEVVPTLSVLRVDLDEPLELMRLTITRDVSEATLRAGLDLAGRLIRVDGR